MKSKILIMALFILFFCFRGLSQIVDEATVPDVVKKSFNDKYKITGSADWELQNDEYTATYYIGNNKGFATFNKDGSFIKSDNELEPTTVPAEVKGYLDNNFKGLTGVVSKTCLKSQANNT